LSDFRNLQRSIAEIQVEPSEEEYFLPGYILLRACITESQALLISPFTFSVGAQPQGDAELEKSELQSYVLNSGFHNENDFSSRFGTTHRQCCTKCRGKVDMHMYDELLEAVSLYKLLLHAKSLHIRTVQRQDTGT
jgi:hypothetical protein